MGNWKKTASVALLATVVLSTAACGRTDTATVSESASAVETGPATGEISVWGLGAGGDALKEIAKDFEAENPDATVTVTAVSWETAHDKISTAIAAGTTPDVAELGTTWMGEFGGTGALDPTPTTMDTPEKFFPSAWEMLEVNGTNYGYPFYAGTFSLFYRKDIAETAGVEAPTTWDELKTFTKALQDNGAEQGIYLPPSGWDWPAFTAMPMGWQAGGEVLNADRTGFTFDTPEWVEAFEFYNSFFTEGIASDHEYAWGEWESALNEGTIGSFIAGADDIATLEGLTEGGFADGKFGVAVLPEGPVNANSYYGGSNLAVFKDSGNRDSAWKFIDYLSQPEVQEKFYDLTGNIPAAVDGWTGKLADSPELAVFGEQLNATTPMPSIPTITQVTAEVDATIESIVKGGTPVDEAVASLQEKVDGIGVGE